MTDKSIFDFNDYKGYLKAFLKSEPNAGHGFRSRLAKALNCQTAYVSQVLNGKAHFSLEQAEAANSFLAHSEDEAQYFLFIVERSRAGTQALQKRLDRQIEAMQKKRMVLKDRVDIKTELDQKDQATYYSSWIYAALHIAVTIPTLRDRKSLAEALKLPQQQTNEALDFLVQVGLLKMEGQEFTTGQARLFLGADSPLIRQHHANWRVQTLKSLDRPTDQDLHYSGVVSLASADVRAIKDRLIQGLNEARKLVKDSKEEELHVIALDFFKL